MNFFVAEVIGTALLMIFGCGVVATASLAGSKGEGSGWIVITTGWGLGVAVAVYSVFEFSSAHINPAVTVGLAASGVFAWSQVPAYIIAQLIGGFIGAVTVWAAYRPHWERTEDPQAKLDVFCTTPAIRDLPSNFVTEAIGTFILVFGVLAIGYYEGELDARSGLQPLLVGFLVWAIGLSLGGPTGYAINPARDLAPRLAHALLPIPGKRDSNWSYAWVPIVAPVVGGALGGISYALLFPG